MLGGDVVGDVVVDVLLFVFDSVSGEAELGEHLPVGEENPADLVLFAGDEADHSGLDSKGEFVEFGFQLVEEGLEGVGLGLFAAVISDVDVGDDQSIG